MSLTLRKAAQGILDDCKLQNFHIGIEPNTKYMQILGECGKPLVSIFGIKFTKISPSKTEIDYSIELLSAFLTAHHSEIYDYIKLKKTHDVYNFVPQITSEYNIGSMAPKILILSYTDKEVSIHLKSTNLDNPLANITSRSLSTISNWQADMDLLAKMRDTLLWYEAQLKRDKILAAALAKLSKCDI